MGYYAHRCGTLFPSATLNIQFFQKSFISIGLKQKIQPAGNALTLPSLTDSMTGRETL